MVFVVSTVAFLSLGGGKKDLKLMHLAVKMVLECSCRCGKTKELETFNKFYVGVVPAPPLKTSRSGMHYIPSFSLDKSAFPAIMGS